MKLFRVMTIRGRRRVLAWYTTGHIDRDDLHTAIVDRMLADGLHIQDVPDVDRIYHERWKIIDTVHGGRIMRAPASDRDAFDVTGVDLKRWPRGRKHKG